MIAVSQDFALQFARVYKYEPLFDYVESLLDHTSTHRLVFQYATVWGKTGAIWQLDSPNIDMRETTMIWTRNDVADETRRT
jgi:hypothetical protein